jgi:hypothetical protein
MTDEQPAAMHRLLAEYHRKLAKEVALDVVQRYHADLAQRLADEAALMPRRGHEGRTHSKSKLIWQLLRNTRVISLVEALMGAPIRCPRSRVEAQRPA